MIKKHENGLNEKTVSHIIRQILSALTYIHSNNIINRDIRLENILIESKEINIIDGNEVVFYNIKINDFKSGRCFSYNKKLNKKVGNPYYIAPEVLKRKYAEKCDVWSCGIIMYILLCGRPPYSGISEKQVIDMVEIGKFQYFGNKCFIFNFF